MRTLILLFVAAFLSGCNKYGEIVHTNGTRLMSVEYCTDRDHWREDFLYDSLGQLTTWHSTKGDTYQLTYQNGRPVIIQSFLASGEESFAYDSITYTPSGRIEKIISIRKSTGEHRWYYAYTYDEHDVLMSSAIHHVKSNDSMLYKKYFWTGDNLSREEEYGVSGKLCYEFFYTYDDKLNYKTILPVYSEFPARSKNNVIQFHWNDYCGNYHSNCRPCDTEYNYNLDGYPVKIKTETGWVMDLTYE